MENVSGAVRDLVWGALTVAAVAVCCQGSRAKLGRAGLPRRSEPAPTKSNASVLYSERPLRG
eukprot:11187090-Lingulodinium_polyedra.AAC.1